MIEAMNKKTSASKPYVERPTVTISLPAGWARAALAGIEGALLGWGLPALGFAVAYLTVAGNPWLKDFGIGEAARMGASFWVSSLGVPVSIGPVAISIIPLLWTFIQVVALRGFLLPTRAFGPAALWIAIPFFVLTSVIIAASAGVEVPTWQVLPGSTLVCVIAVLWAFVQQSQTVPGWVDQVQWLWAGARTGMRWTGVTALVGLGFFVGALVVSWSSVQDATALLTPTPGASFGLGLLQGLYALAYPAWALSWLAGPGFTSVGEQISSPTSVAPPTDFIPIIAAVPTTAPGAWVAWTLVGVGLVLAGVFAYRTRALPLVEAARTGGVAVVVFAALIWAWLSASSGSLGVDRLAVLGPVSSAWLAVTGLVGAVAGFGGLALHSEVREWAVSTWRTLVSQVPSRSQEDTESGGESHVERESIPGTEPHASSTALAANATSAHTSTIAREEGRLASASARGAVLEEAESTATVGEPDAVELTEDAEVNLGAVRDDRLRSLRANWAQIRRADDPEEEV